MTAENLRKIDYVVLFAGFSPTANELVKSESERFRSNGISTLILYPLENSLACFPDANILKANEVTEHNFHNCDIIDCSSPWNYSQIFKRGKLGKKIDMTFSGRRYWKLVKELLCKFPVSFQPSCIIYSDHDSLTPAWHLSRIWKESAVHKIGEIPHES
jgi:hypothetical protein